MATDPRLPHLVLIGAQKSATTTLYRWLGEQPEFYLASPKETNFFSSDWHRGLAWYSGQFDAAPGGRLLGEASVNYTIPRFARQAAERMAGTIPGARLVFVARHPVQRLRSHYRHEVQRSRETRPLLEALREPGNPYVGTSCYDACLKPYYERFPTEQILVVRFEDLVGGSPRGWHAVLRHLGVPERAVPTGAHNVTRQNAQWTRTFLWLKRRRILDLRRVSRMPAPVRRVGKRVLMRDGDAYHRRLDRSLVPIPGEITAVIWEDAARLAERLGRADPLWVPDGAHAVPGGAAP